MKRSGVSARHKGRNGKGKTFLEFFAGIGLVRSGLADSGWECIYANDNEPRKFKLYEAIHGRSPEFHLHDVGDTEAVASAIVGTPFLATASFPCTDMSLAGHYKGFAGDESSVFFGFVNVLNALGRRRPKVVMLENVAGFVTAHGGKDFAAAAHALASLGYYLDAFMLNAEYFTPQSRQRVFVIGVAKSLRPAIAEPTLHPLRPHKLVDLMKRTELSTGWACFDLPSPPERQTRLQDVIDFDDDQDWWGEREVKRHFAMMYERQQKEINDRLARGGRHVATAFRRIRHGAQRAETRFDGLAGCLRTPRGGSAKQIVVVMDRGKLRMRWMSPAEYSRLQGLELPASVVARRNELLMGFGDAVCVPVIRWIDDNVLSPLFDAARKKSVKARAG
jgi:DNA (cytosine-5)-methyltransferase 1